VLGNAGRDGLSRASGLKHRVLATLDASYVLDTAQRFCTPLLVPYLAG
jgi:hypothetical protein